MEFDPLGLLRGGARRLEVLEPEALLREQLQDVLPGSRRQQTPQRPEGGRRHVFLLPAEHAQHLEARLLARVQEPGYVFILLLQGFLRMNGESNARPRIK